MKELWTDGSASPNPGPGGFAVLEDGCPVRLGREKESTNIRMEACALIAAMEYAGEDSCTIYTDSEFWINVLTKWAKNWEKNGWKKARGEIKNLELVKKLWELYSRGKIQLNFTYGHVGTEFNELADSWAKRAREGETASGVKLIEITKGEE